MDKAKFREIFERRLVYSIQGMDAVQVEREIPYKSDSAPLMMDVYRPPGLAAGERRPGVIFVHGGPLSPHLFPESVLHPKNWGTFISYGELIAASGLVAVTFNYRFHGLQSIDRAAEDVRDAISFARQHAAKINLDADRLTLWVFSGGGILLGHLLQHPIEAIRALIAFYPLLDFNAFAGMGVGQATPETVRAHTPAHHLAAGLDHPPLFLARAGRDQPATLRGIDNFLHSALGAEMEIDFYNHPRGIHAFDIFNDDARSKEIIARALTFLGGHLHAA